MLRKLVLTCAPDGYRTLADTGERLGYDAADYGVLTSPSRAYEWTGPESTGLCVVIVEDTTQVRDQALENITAALTDAGHGDLAATVAVHQYWVAMPDGLPAARYDAVWDAAQALHAAEAHVEALGADATAEDLAVVARLHADLTPVLEAMHREADGGVTAWALDLAALAGGLPVLDPRDG